MLLLLKDSGARGVEVDLAFTADGVGILFHDMSVDRLTDDSGYVADLTYEYISSLDVAAKHSCRPTSGVVKIPKLEECLETCLELDLMVYIDCKSKPKQTADLLCGLFKKHPKLYNKAVVCSFFPLVIYAVRNADPRIMTGQTLRHWALQFRIYRVPEHVTKWWHAVLAPVLDVILEWSIYSWVWFLCGNSFTLICKDDLSRETCTYFRKLGSIVIPWTVNDKAEKDFFQQSLKCPIMTDHVKDC
ncbi:glycerophosphodiester phosphodiesterase 1-like isoform X2 [Gigantopelta aegis]|uniref:glycerophosphodiester phosphodiesterase 1-like isoform X2 n=1 Tax=Gigantopelta aegis TaxID=1735272 RepID=UPI001B88DA9F|nr:glycerophosphodiester phosphodiesterase 1-like isoform X2 [Gigantopelta aegis]